MFSSRAPKLLGAALLDLAEAVLRPVDEDWDADLNTDTAGERTRDRRPTPGRAATAGSACSRAVESDRIVPAHPHRQAVRIERRRRPGTIPPAAQPCTTPLPAPSARTPRAPAHRA